MLHNSEAILLILEPNFFKQPLPMLWLNQSEFYENLHFQRQDLVFGNEIEYKAEGQCTTRRWVGQIELLAFL